MDPNKIIPRVPDELLVKAYQRRFNRNDCINRGFILDGYPRIYEIA